MWAGAGSPSAPLLLQPRSVWSDTAMPDSGGGKMMPICSLVADTVSAKSNDSNSLGDTSVWTPSNLIECQ